MNEIDEARFWSKVDTSAGPDGCWPWTAAILATGYGGFKYRGKMTKAHRVAYELFHGSLGDRLALHRCDNPPCVNPTHLFAGTHADNAADRNRKGRQSVGNRVAYERRPRGSAHPDAKLTEEHVREIRSQLGVGVSLQALATLYGVTKSTIHHIAKGKTWRHVEEANR